MAKRQLTEQEAERVGAIFEAHKGFLESVAKRHCNHPQDVPDIVQAVGVRLCKFPNAFRGDARLTTFLFRVTVNTARSYHKSGMARHARIMERATQPIVDDMQRQVLDPDDFVTAGERHAALHEAIGQLSQDDQEVLRNLLADGVVLPDSRIKKRRYFARRRLRDILATDPRLSSDE